MEKKRDLRIARYSDDDYMKVIEIAIELGKPVLLENVTEQLDGPLLQLLKRQLYCEGASNQLYE
jgi:dynein heavy chain